MVSMSWSRNVFDICDVLLVTGDFDTEANTTSTAYCIEFKIREWILLYVTFCPMMAISRQKEARSRDYALLLFQMTSKILYSAQYHIGSTVNFEQFGALYMHNHDDK